MKFKDISQLIGWLLIAVGVIISILAINPTPVTKYVLFLGLMITSSLSVRILNKSLIDKVNGADFFWMALISLSYAFTVIFLANDVDTFLYITSAFASVIGLHLIIAFNAKKLIGNDRMGLQFYKSLAGLLIIVLAGLILITSFRSITAAIFILGLTKIIIGVSFIVIAKSINPIISRKALTSHGV